MQSRRNFFLEFLSKTHISYHPKFQQSCFSALTTLNTLHALEYIPIDRCNKAHKLRRLKQDEPYKLNMTRNINSYDPFGFRFKTCRFTFQGLCMLDATLQFNFSTYQSHVQTFFPKCKQRSRR